MDQHKKALEAIRKKLVGKKLTYQEIYAIMDQISHQKLGDVLTTYFTASGYSRGFSDEEIYSLTKAMVETGDKLHFNGIVADKHSIGGVPGTRTTLCVVPIVAAAGFTIPKSSSRAITTPSGTADVMEVLASVKFRKDDIYKIIKKTNGCIVWGGSFHIAPADDVIIKIEEKLLFESYDKILVSIMAKKIAFGSNHVIIDLPYGQTVKVHKLKDAEVLKEKFEYLAKRFRIKLKVLIHRTDQPFGQGIGPLLEARDVLRILQRKNNAPVDLEIRSLNLAGNLLDLCLLDLGVLKQKEIKEKFGNGIGWATNILETKKAWQKMQEIIKAQEGNPNIDSEDLKPGKHSLRVAAGKKGIIKKINSQNITLLAKILGSPNEKKSGIYIHKKIGAKIDKESQLCTLFSEKVYNLKEARESIKSFPIFTIE